MKQGLSPSVLLEKYAKKQENKACIMSVLMKATHFMAKQRQKITQTSIYHLAWGCILRNIFSICLIISKTGAPQSINICVGGKKGSSPLEPRDYTWKVITDKQRVDNTRILPGLGIGRARNSN